MVVRRGDKLPKLRRRDASVPWQAHHIEQLPPAVIKPDPGNPRKHTRKQIDDLTRIIAKLGFSNPLLIDENNRIIAGHARLLVAKLLRLASVPCIRLSHLDEAEKMTLAVADNAMSDASSWDDALLRAVLLQLDDVNFDLNLTGLDTGKIDFCLDGPVGGSRADPADTFAPVDPARNAITRRGFLWRLGPHRLLCGDALDASSYDYLLGDDRADVVVADPPYNVRVAGHVSGLGRVRHREFAMASGEMSSAEYKAFLATAADHMAAYSVDGSIHFIFIDWRHIDDVLDAGKGVYTELKNICVWDKTNAGMGSLYRSQHELVAVFKHGSAPYINNVELGKHGRNRSNLWEYAGANAFGPTRDADLEVHPTVKPIALVADAIRDVSKRGGLVLDPFAGSGVTLLAAERCGRRAAAMEIDPLYVDVAVRRWQALTGKAAILDGDGWTFEALEKASTVLALEDHSSRGEAPR